jgi:hypothetical protein
MSASGSFKLTRFLVLTLVLSPVSYIVLDHFNCKNCIFCACDVPVMWIVQFPYYMTEYCVWLLRYRLWYAPLFCLILPLYPICRFGYMLLFRIGRNKRTVVQNFLGSGFRTSWRERPCVREGGDGRVAWQDKWVMMTTSIKWLVSGIRCMIRMLNECSWNWVFKTCTNIEMYRLLRFYAMNKYNNPLFVTSCCTYSLLLLNRIHSPIKRFYAMLNLTDVSEVKPSSMFMFAWNIFPLNSEYEIRQNKISFLFYVTSAVISFTSIALYLIQY